MTCLYRRAPGKDERKSRIKLKKDGRSIAFEVFSDCSEAKPKLITEPTVFASSRNRKKKLKSSMEASVSGSIRLSNLIVTFGV